MIDIMTTNRRFFRFIFQNTTPTMHSTLRFTKMQGTGNDFIIVLADDIRPLRSDLTEGKWGEFIKQICHRHFGLGADGFMIASPAAESGVVMEYYNSDGSTASFCGNGARCIARYASLHGWIESQGFIHAAVGKVPFRMISDGDVSIHMPDAPYPRRIANHTGFFIDTGVPHLVENITFGNDSAFTAWAEPLSGKSAQFPEGVNVDAYHLEGDKLHVYTYERGVDAETLSCGTGVVASVLTAGFLSGADCTRYSVYTRGGRLNVSFTRNRAESKFQDIWLTGPAERVAEGEYYYSTNHLMEEKNECKGK